jgi:hypothetical protein
MMRGAAIYLLKQRRTGPESVEQAEGCVAKFDKNFIDRSNLAPALPQQSR